MLWLLLLSLLPAPIVHDECDVIERNRVYAEATGELCGDWIVLWSFTDGSYRVREWRATKDVGPLGKVLQFWDAKTKCNRRIEGRVFVETQTWYDREVESRKEFPEAKRRRLSSK